MQFRLERRLPLEVNLGTGVYVLELVDCESGGECWLRVRAAGEPVVFLLARFPDRPEARRALQRGFDAGPFEFSRLILQRLVAEGRASWVEPVETTREIAPPLPRAPRDAPILTLALAG